MIELPEAITLASQLRESLAGRKAVRVFPPSKAHKFCWFNGEPETYDEILRGSLITGADGFGIFAEISFDNGRKLCINDGVNVRLTDGQLPKCYQLAIELDDGECLVFTVAMYGGICLHDGSYDNSYYLSSRRAVTPFSPGFPDYFSKTAEECRQNLSAKAFLATEQRFPGLGNGVLQDILFTAGIHPKRKLSTLDNSERQRLSECVRSVMTEMKDRGGRDTEKDLFGNPGGYRTLMSKNTVGSNCPKCGGEIVKEAYLGGSVYYCANCQRL